MCSFETRFFDSRHLNSTCPDNKVEKCRYIDYDTSLWTRNLVMHLDLVCDRAWMRALPNYGWFIGMCLTTFTLQLPDFFGRWRVLFASQVGIIMSVFLVASSQSIYIYS